MKTGSLLWKVQPPTWCECTETWPGYQANALNVKWHQTLTVLSSKYIVLDKKSIPIVAYMVRAETQSVRCESYRFVLQEHSFGKEVNPNCGLVSRQTDRHHRCTHIV